MPLLLLLLLLGSSTAVPLDSSKIREQLSREVEEEFSGKETQDRLAKLRDAYAKANPGTDNAIHPRTELEVNANRTDLFEGDMQLTPEQWAVASDYSPENPRHRRQALASSASLWQPIGAPVVPWVIPDDFPRQFMGLLHDGMAYWQARTCVTFRPAKDSDPSAIVFSANSSGCWSYAGRQAFRQQLHLHNPYCMTMNTLLHELAHALGVLHVQSRHDRDSYVTLDTANIESGQEHNFLMEPAGVAPTYDVPYEYQSVMHYHQFAFAINTSRPTLYTNEARFQRSMDGPRPTFWDVALINRMYKCTDKCARQMVCQNNGVTDARDCNKCFCPRGWTGMHCELRPANAIHVNMAERNLTRWSLPVSVEGPYAGYEELLWIITAPVGKHARIYLNAMAPRTPDFSICRSIGIEVQHLTDTRQSGIKHCENAAKHVLITSQSNVAQIWAYREVDIPLRGWFEIEVV